MHRLSRRGPGYTSARRLVIAKFCTAAVGAALLVGASGTFAQSRQPIVISTSEATREIVNARLLGRMLERSGFRVTYAKLSPDELPDALANGAVHMVPELTPAQIEAAFRGPIDDGRVLDLGHRQANASDPPLRKLAWSGARKRWKGAVKLFKNMTMPESDTVAMVTAVDVDGRAIDEVVDDWLKRNRKRWARWVSSSKNWMKP